MKYNKQSKEKDKAYFLEGIKMLLSQEETVDNFLSVLEEYKIAQKNKEDSIDKLNNEIKIIKKLKV